MEEPLELTDDQIRIELLKQELGQQKVNHSSELVELKLNHHKTVVELRSHIEQLTKSLYDLQHPRTEEASDPS